ncbi:MAG: DNA-3-methyladenine glycosylase I [Candidatus Doudnabacteria bacterium]|nr:DNA-3-methyladenine glycosylase I [Candidatus Doudnabacteria bacterium]
MDQKRRCPWVNLKNPKYIAYHDEEWGVPVHDDAQLFAKLTLDSFQSGLSWEIVLNKRDGFLAAFDNFDPEKVAGYDEGKIADLLQDAGIIRNRAKIMAAVNNARAYLQLGGGHGKFSALLWSFVGGETIDHHIRSEADYLATSPESDAMSKALKELGFKFVGSTVCFAFMQAVGMYNDHIDYCFRREQV